MSPAPTGSAAGPLRDYEAALDWLDSHIDLERLLGSPEATAPTLDRMWTLMGVLGDPQDSVPAIHITGTNGKGSTARLSVALLGACGLGAGSYTSPHIERVNDRITVANEPLDDASFATAISEVAVFESTVTELCGERPNYFEVMAAAAYNWFASTAHVNVIEVGMGGRWDATNVVDAAVAVITNVGADHLEIIGPTLADVASEKAGIISAGAIAVCGETAPELVEIVARHGRRGRCGAVAPRRRLGCHRPPTRRRRSARDHSVHRLGSMPNTSCRSTVLIRRSTSPRPSARLRHSSAGASMTM